VYKRAAFAPEIIEAICLSAEMRAGAAFARATIAMVEMEK
jgi:hypothetical protein